MAGVEEQDTGLGCDGQRLRIWRGDGCLQRIGGSAESAPVRDGPPRIRVMQQLEIHRVHHPPCLCIRTRDENSILPTEIHCLLKDRLSSCVKAGQGASRATRHA